MIYYEYGGIKCGQNTKSHICDNMGIVLCGVKSKWMEAGEPIIKVGNEYFCKNSEYLFPMTDRRHFTCKKCYAKFMSLKNKI